MLTRAENPKRSLFIDALSHVRNILIHEKFISHSHDVTGKVHTICNRLNKSGNLVSWNTFIEVAKVEEC